MELLNSVNKQTGQHTSETKETIRTHFCVSIDPVAVLGNKTTAEVSVFCSCFIVPEVLPNFHKVVVLPQPKYILYKSCIRGQFASSGPSELSMNRCLAFVDCRLRLPFSHLQNKIVLRQTAKEQLTASRLQRRLTASKRQ